MKYTYTVKKKKTRTLSMRITGDCVISVCAGYCFSDEDINNFVCSHEKWIDKNMPLAEKRRLMEQKLPEKAEGLKAKAKTVIADRLAFYSTLMNVSFKGFKITNARTRFGSCSEQNSLCFSYRLMLYPQSAVDYVVVHELAHTVYKNHSKNFYGLIEKYLPDYKEREKLLKAFPEEQL